MQKTNEIIAAWKLEFELSTTYFQTFIFLSKRFRLTQRFVFLIQYNLYQIGEVRRILTIVFSGSLLSQYFASDFLLQRRCFIITSKCYKIKENPKVINDGWITDALLLEPFPCILFHHFLDSMEVIDCGNSCLTGTNKNDYFAEDIDEK